MIQIPHDFLINSVFFVLILIGLVALVSIFWKLQDLKDEFEALKILVKHLEDNDNECRRKIGLPPSSPHFWI